MAIALVCASAGGMLSWHSGPSKGLLLIARREGYLPPCFQHQNENVVAVNILVVQGYCPEELDQFRDKINDYKVDDTIKD